ncbi:MAG: alpha/beta hydrolase [Planctomycetaceae bacterium]|nr:alpha/beta hydrolase [Planctomycetaceae bacterium]
MKNHCRMIVGMLLAFQIVGLAQGQTAKTALADREFKTRVDLVYARSTSRELCLDLYVPVSHSPVPIIIWVHGGAWRQGGKRLSKARVREVINRGYALASVEYRLSQEALFPAQIQDCKAAIRWLRAHAKQYGFNGQRIGVWGSSAGGHLGALLGTSGEVKSLEGVGEHLDYSSRVQAVCDWFGPTDFLQMNAHAPQDNRLDHDAADSPESQLVGGPIQAHPDKVRAANPITYVTSDDAPFLIMHGDRDPLVPFHQSQLLYRSLQMAGVESQLRRIKGAGHGGAGFHTAENRTALWNFFDKQLKADR